MSDSYKAAIAGILAVVVFLVVLMLGFVIGVNHAAHIGKYCMITDSALADYSRCITPDK